MEKVIIFGAGENAKKLLRCLKSGVHVIAFIDNNVLKQGTFFNDRKIISVGEVKEYSYDYILVASINYSGIVAQLVENEIEANKIICPFEYDHDKYNEWRSILNIEELIYIEMNSKIEKMSKYIENLEYELASKIKNNRIMFPKILPWERAIEEIVVKGKSMSRFGDGEFDLMLGKKHVFQTYNDQLVAKMKEVLTSNLDNHIVGLPDGYGDFDGRTDDFVECFRNHFKDGYREKEYALIDMNKEYYDSFITRPYKIYKDKMGAKQRFDMVKTIWEGRDLTIVEGEKICLTMQNLVLEF